MNLSGIWGRQVEYVSSICCESTRTCIDCINQWRSLDRSIDRSIYSRSTDIWRKLLIIITTLIEYCALHSFSHAIFEYEYEFEFEFQFEFEFEEEQWEHQRIIHYELSIDHKHLEFPFWDTLHWGPLNVERSIDGSIEVLTLYFWILRLMKLPRRTCCCPLLWLPLQREQFMHESNF